MSNFYLDNDDLRFYVEHVLPWAELEGAVGGAGEKGRAEEWRDLLEAIGDFVGNEAAPQVAAIDREGVALSDGEVRYPPRLSRLVAQMSELGLHKLSLPEELGGLGAPFVVYFLACEIFSRADPALMTHFAFHGGIAAALLSFSIQEGTTRFDPATGKILATRFGEAIEEVSEGRAWGSMDITEPDCGSDMAAMRTRATLGADGVWRLSGQKVFITVGHGKYHIVIARSGRDPSLPATRKGELGDLDQLGLFLVPAWEDLPDGTRKRHIKLLRAEDKLGHHASPTMVVELDDAPGHLIGKAGEGFQYMLQMMNSARVGVSCEAVGILEATSRLAHAYAAERRSMGKTIDQHEMIAEHLDEMRVDTLGLRALAMRCAVHTELAQRLDLRERIARSGGVISFSEGRALRRHRAVARELTPLLKYLSAEQAVLHARRALQIHGGVGYTTDYGIEKIYRDAPVVPIYEGTSQIQALMAMKDQLGAAMKAPQDFMRKEAEARWRSLSARDPLERATMRLRTLGLSAIRHLLLKTATNKLKTLRGQPLSSWSGIVTGGWDPKRDFSWALLHAERLTRLLADHAIAETLLDQSQRFPAWSDRREVLEAHLERAEPRGRFLLDEITNSGGRLLGRLARRTADAAASPSDRRGA